MIPDVFNHKSHLQKHKKERRINKFCSISKINWTSKELCPPLPLTYLVTFSQPLWDAIHGISTLYSKTTDVVGDWLTTCENNAKRCLSLV